MCFTPFLFIQLLQSCGSHQRLIPVLSRRTLLQHSERLGKYAVLESTLTNYKRACSAILASLKYKVTAFGQLRMKRRAFFISADYYSTI